MYYDVEVDIESVDCLFILSIILLIYYNFGNIQKLQELIRLMLRVYIQLYNQQLCNLCKYDTLTIQPRSSHLLKI